MAMRPHDIKAKAKAKKVASNRKLVEEELAKPVRRGPPCKPVDLEEVERLATIDATADEIAAMMGIDRQTIYNRVEILDAMKRGREKGNFSLRRTLNEMAHAKVPQVAIFLGKARLGMNDGGNQGTQEQKPFTKTEI